MTNEQILKKAIEKAVENGWDRIVSGRRYAVDEVFMNWDTVNIIFSHSFAKAFWGQEEACQKEHSQEDFVGGYCDKQMWQYHLAQMVLEEEPLKYIEKFL